MIGKKKNPQPINLPCIAHTTRIRPEESGGYDERGVQWKEHEA